MDGMRKMMGNMMSSAMPPMMDKMFSAVAPEQRVEFVNTMMPRCLEIVLDSLDQPGRERLARDMIDSFSRLAERYVSVDDTPATPGPEVATPGETSTGGD
ncbi:hypothetical protein, partial [Ferrimicrobium acidiphilum]